MFGAEPREAWGDGERREFEEHVAARTRGVRRRALWASGVFVATIALLSLFSARRPMHRYWESVGGPLLLVSLAEMLWVLYCWLLVYGSWSVARETRREME